MPIEYFFMIVAIGLMINPFFHAASRREQGCPILCLLIRVVRFPEQVFSKIRMG